MTVRNEQRECARCKRLEQRIDELEAKIAKLAKNSSNSSKPPSSDIAKPGGRAKKPKKKRKRGAQPGHVRHQRTPFQENEIDRSWDYTIDTCPDCGHQVRPSDQPPRVLQQIDVVATPTIVSEHRSQAFWCKHCQKTHFAPVHEEVRKAGLVGPRLTALVAYLKGACHCSFSTIRKFLRDVVGVTICRGQLRKVCAKVSDSLQGAYDGLLGALPTEDVLNVDETGHKDSGRRMWTWCFRAATFTLFKIDPSRGSCVLVDVLGEEFDGVLGCDYFSAYRKYMGDCGVLVQFCLAHLIRDVKFLVKHPDSKNRAYGKRVLTSIREMFGVIHRRDEMTAAGFSRRLQETSAEVQRQATYRVPAASEAQNLANRFHRHGESYLRFVTTPGIEPTNNLAEQAIRFVVIDRRITQGSRSEAGQRWLERIWTTIATCTHNGVSVFNFLHESITAQFQNVAGPSLVAINNSS